MQIFVSHSTNNNEPKVDIMGMTAEEAKNLYLALSGQFTEFANAETLLPLCKALRPFKTEYWK